MIGLGGMDGVVMLPKGGKDFLYCCAFCVTESDVCFVC